MTPSRDALKRGLVVDVSVGETLTLHPSQDTRTVVVRVLEKTGRRTKLRVQSTHDVLVTRENGELAHAAG